MTTLSIIKASGSYASSAVVEVSADTKVPGGSTITISGVTAAGPFSVDHFITEDYPAQFVTSNLAKQLNQEVADADFGFIESPPSIPPVIALTMLSDNANAVTIDTATIA